MTEPTPVHPENADTGSATGHPEVDAVLTSLTELADRPVEDHLEVLSAAHERLHTTLDEHRGHDEDAAGGPDPR